MIVAIGSDHRGFEVRHRLADYLSSLDYELVDCGTENRDSCDYPDIVARVAADLESGVAQRGILLCGTGIGMAMAANKFSFIRAVVACELPSALLSRQHNDANVLCLSADRLIAEDCWDDQPVTQRHTPLVQIARQWLGEPFDGGRHQRRVDKMSKLGH